METTPIRIVFIISRLSVGSPAMHAALLTQRFGPPGYEGTLMCGEVETDGGDMAYFAEAHHVKPVYVRGMAGSLNPFSNVLVIWRLYRLLRQIKPDVVHTHMARAGFVGRVSAWLAGVPVIVHTFHGVAFSDQHNSISTRLFIFLERIAASMSDTIITLTQSLRHELAETYGVARQARMTILPLGLDLESFTHIIRKQGDFRKQWQIPADAPLIGIVGRLAPIKNHDLFLQAAALVKAQVPDAHFVIVGDGETRTDVEAQVNALKLRDSTTFTGWQRDLLPLYSDLDVLVNSSISEGTPTPIIEALAAGCPVVATGVGGVPDMLDHGQLGMLALPGNPVSLADTILLALRNPPDGAHAREIILNRYSIDRLVRDLDSLYHGLLARKGRAQR
jgi:glycosyltransferase involved in cell wall biosynthesis